MTNSNLVSLFYDKDTNISRKELAMRYVNLYFIIVGGLANITNDMILKAIEQLKTNKKLYRQSVKFHINKAEASSRVVVSSFRQGSFEVGAMTIYDTLLVEIKNVLSYDIICQQTTISNLLLKAKTDNVYTKTAILTALQFARLQDYLSKEIEALVNSQGFRGNIILLAINSTELQKNWKIQYTTSCLKLRYAIFLMILSLNALLMLS